MNFLGGWEGGLGVPKVRQSGRGNYKRLSHGNRQLFKLEGPWDPHPLLIQDVLECSVTHFGSGGKLKMDSQACRTAMKPEIDIARTTTDTVWCDQG